MMYRVRMIIGSDTCTSVTDVEATCPEGAYFAAEMQFSKTTVKIVNVELGDECQNHLIPCTFKGHECPRCGCHLNDEGECFECI
jgi:hypothetical protein